ncbi:MAG: SAM-dependent methyltransferase [Actinomadura sp.]
MPESTPHDSIDSTRPHQARIWAYWLGSKDNYPIDREIGDKMVTVFPEMVDIARQSRAFLTRVVRFLGEQRGIDQYLDIGTGLPAADNTHEVAQRINPRARIVYSDNDPLVLVHARALLTGTPEGACAYLDADVRETGRILRTAAETLDFSRPIALMLLGVMGNVPESEDPHAIVRTLVDALPSGSYLVVNDGTNVLGVTDDTAVDDTGRAESIRLYVEAGATPYYPRTPDYIAGFFEGLELEPPGVVSTSQWRPDFVRGAEEATPVDAFCGVARKP